MEIIRTILLVFALYGTYQQITNDILAITKGGYNDTVKSRYAAFLSAIVSVLWGLIYYLSK